MSERKAYVARHRFIAGAFAYLNAKQVEETGDTRTLERWLAQGATVAKVPLEQAVRELQEHIEARREGQWIEDAMNLRGIPFPGTRIVIEHNPGGDELPIFLRKQAD